MYIYNVTTIVQHAIHIPWVKWMQEEHIPAVVASGCFTHFQMVRLLETDEAEGVTYATQFFVQSQELYERYVTDFAPALRKVAENQWGDAIFGFRSFMQIVAQ